MQPCSQNTPPTSTFCEEVSVKKGMDMKQLVLKWVRNVVAGLGLQKPS